MTLMNAEERARFLEALRGDEEFRASVRRELLTEELLNLPATVAALVDTLARQRQDFIALSNELTAVSQSVADYMQQTISAIGQGFTAVRTELGSLRTEVGDLRTDVRAGFTAVWAKFDQVDADLREIRDRLGP